ncbi:hypothetical protein GOP47_0019054 [Adiantum capillus-veneris]|uniref:Secreted protein n=1 Tax=Adiantum capillus-veneris TaxID=13818 RepID=A0A9D4ZA94_ADICA|nr:hypothetical protein GOP47_0019054 [Adiantum capillus-veneris]
MPRKAWMRFLILAVANCGGGFEASFCVQLAFTLFQAVQPPMKGVCRVILSRGHLCRLFEATTRAQLAGITIELQEDLDNTRNMEVDEPTRKQSGLQLQLQAKKAPLSASRDRGVVEISVSLASTPSKTRKCDGYRRRVDRQIQGVSKKSASKSCIGDE